MSAPRYVLALLGVLALVAAVAAGGYALQWFTAEPRGALDAREQTVADGDFRLAAYDRFFAACAAVQAQEDRLGALEAELASGPPESRRVQILASMTAVRAGRDELIREYNADATREGTVGQFRDADLPYQLDTTTQETRCAA